MSFEFMRGVIGIIGLGCAHMLGRALVGVRKGRTRLSNFYAWVLRTLICLGAVALRHSFDVTDLVIWGLAVVAFAAGSWDAARDKPVEDLTHQIFPEDDKP